MKITEAMALLDDIEKENGATVGSSHTKGKSQSSTAQGGNPDAG